MSRLIVIGAGVSGLTAAFWAQRAGWEVTVLEAAAVPGGTMRTDHENGWLIETGPNSALETTPIFGEMFELLGITGERRYASDASNKRYVLRNGTLYPIPMSPGAFLATRLWSTRGKLRLLREPLVGKGTKEETIAEFVERRLGRELLDYGINPFVAGVYAGNPEELSVRSAFPKLYALEEKYGGLIKGMIKGARERKKRAEVAKDRARMFSFAHGMQTFPEALARSLGKQIFYATSVRSIEVQSPAGNAGPRFRVNAAGGVSVEGDAVVLGVPAYAAADLLRPLTSALADMLAHVYYPPVAEVFLGFHSSQCGRPLDGFGYLIPAREKRTILGTIWSSVIFADRAPDDHVALTTFVGGSRQPELLSLDDTQLQEVVLGELARIMNVSGAPVFSRIYRWERAIPQYNIGYQSVVEAIEQFERETPGFYICSNYRGGIAVGDCVMNGKKTAERLTQS
jgi:protoporphyrinogen/coproporphyrinogen III oxidase